jgi:hypothetical protein
LNILLLAVEAEGVEDSSVVAGVLADFEQALVML